MKNKEIEEMIQNRIEDIYQSGEYIYQAKELEEILSCIEQLEKDNYDLDKENQMLFEKNLQLETDYKEASESVTWWRNRYNAVERDKKQLENNRDKAIKYMQDFIFEPLLVQEDRKLIMFNENLRNFENILKGDSDE